MTLGRVLNSTGLQWRILWNHRCDTYYFPWSSFDLHLFLFLFLNVEMEHKNLACSHWSAFKVNQLFKELAGEPKLFLACTCILIVDSTMVWVCTVSFELLQNFLGRQVSWWPWCWSVTHWARCGWQLPQDYQQKVWVANKSRDCTIQWPETEEVLMVGEITNRRSCV